MAVTNGWGKGAQNSTNGWGKSGTNNIGYGAIYESSAAGDTALIGTSAAFLYSKSSFNQGEADPTPTITGTAGGSFNASANVVFVDTGTFNSSTGQIDLSATSIGSHIITYTVNGVQSGQTVGVTAVPYASTSSFSFDGINDYFETGLNLAYTTHPNITLSCWVKMDKSNLSTFTSYSVLGVRSAAFQNGSPIRILTNGTKQAFVAIQGQGGTTQSTTDLSDGNWHSVILTSVYDSGGTIQNVFINGVPEISNKLLISYAPLTGSLYIGVRDEFLAQYYNGNIDEVSIWNTTLSQSAITEIASGPNDLTTLTNASNTNLKAWYKF